MNTWLSAVNTLSSQERRLVDSVSQAVHSTAALESILTQSFQELTQLIPADCASLCIAASPADGGRPDFRWFPVHFHPGWYAEYATMAPHDFVCHAVSRLPNVVLRDEDMLPRSLFESNQMYRRARQIGFPLEQVLAVSFAAIDGPISGICLFRNERGAFTRHEQRLMQLLSSVYHDRIRSCALLDQGSIKSAVFERLFGLNDAAVIAFSARGRELFRSASTGGLLQRWFGGDNRIPEELKMRLQRVQADPHGAGATAWVLPGNEADLVATFFHLDLSGALGDANSVVCVVLREASHVVEPPALWSSVLTKRELEIAAYVLRGSTNEAIAAHSGCSPKTVKKHLEHIYDKLGVGSRAALCSLARRRE